MSDILETFPQVVPITSEAELAALRDAAAADKHGTLLPTHIIWKNRKIAGCFSVARVPLVTTWLSTTDMHGRDTLIAVNAVENIVSGLGGGLIVAPVQKDSPLFPVMERLGYSPCGEFTLFQKNLAKGI